MCVRAPWTLLVAGSPLHALFSGSSLTLLLASLGPAHICKATGVTAGSSLTPFLAKTCNNQKHRKVALLSANPGVALTDNTFTAASGRRRRGDMKRNSACGTLRFHHVPPAQRRLWVALHFSSQPSPPDPGWYKKAPRFLLQNSPTSPGCRAEFGTVFGSWHSWRSSAHTLVCRLPKGSQPGRSSQAGPRVCLDLCTAKVILSATQINRAASRRTTHTMPRRSTLFTTFWDAAT